MTVPIIVFCLIVFYLITFLLGIAALAFCQAIYIQRNFKPVLYLMTFIIIFLVYAVFNVSYIGVSYTLYRSFILKTPYDLDYSVRTLYSLMRAGLFIAGWLGLIKLINNKTKVFTVVLLIAAALVEPVCSYFNLNTTILTLITWPWNSIYRWFSPIVSLILLSGILIHLKTENPEGKKLRLQISLLGFLGLILFIFVLDLIKPMLDWSVWSEQMDYHLFFLFCIITAVWYEARYLRKNKTPDLKVEEIIKKKQSLTEREKEILSMIQEDISNAQIASRLFISVATVKKHIYNIFQKLGIRNRIELRYILKNLSK